MVLPGHVLLHGLVLVLQPRTGPGLDDLKEDSVAQLVLVPEVGGCTAGVEELLAGVLPGDVREVEIALNVHSQAGGVDCLQRSIGALRDMRYKNSSKITD